MKHVANITPAPAPLYARTTSLMTPGRPYTLSDLMHRTNIGQHRTREDMLNAVTAGEVEQEDRARNWGLLVFTLKHDSAEMDRRAAAKEDRLKRLAEQATECMKNQPLTQSEFEIRQAFVPGEAFTLVMLMAKTRLDQKTSMAAIKGLVSKGRIEKVRDAKLWKIAEDNT